MTKVIKNPSLFKTAIDCDNRTEKSVTYNTSPIVDTELSEHQETLTKSNTWYSKGRLLGKKVEKNVKLWFRTFINNDKDAQMKLIDLQNSAIEFKIHLNSRSKSTSFKCSG